MNILIIKIIVSIIEIINIILKIKIINMMIGILALIRLSYFVLIKTVAIFFPVLSINRKSAEW